MASPYARLGVGISINLIAGLFLGYTLLSDGGDFYLNLNRTYLALTMVAPMIVALLLVTPAAHQSLAVNCVLMGAFAVLLTAAFALPRPPAFPGGEKIAQKQEAVAPVQGTLVRY